MGFAEIDICVEQQSSGSVIVDVIRLHILLMTTNESTKLLAAAIYELRLLLSDHIGSQSESDPNLRLAAHLAYALHNEALAVMESDGKFDIDATRERIRVAESIVGSKFADNGGHLLGEVSE